MTGDEIRASMIACAIGYRDSIADPKDIPAVAANDAAHFSRFLKALGTRDATVEKAAADFAAVKTATDARAILTALSR